MIINFEMSNQINMYDSTPNRQNTPYQELYPMQDRGESNDVTIDMPTAPVASVASVEFMESETPDMPPPPYEDIAGNIHAICKKREQELNKEIADLKIQQQRQHSRSFMLGVFVTCGIIVTAFLVFQIWNQ